MAEAYLVIGKCEVSDQQSGDESEWVVAAFTLLADAELYAKNCNETVRRVWSAVVERPRHWDLTGPERRQRTWALNQFLKSNPQECDSNMRFDDDCNPYYELKGPFPLK